MTEAEWLAIEDPRLLLGWLTGDPPAGHAADLRLLGHCPVKLSDRKRRLFACACCRRAWHLLADGRSRRAVEVAEQYADGAVRVKGLGEAWGDAVKAREDLRDARLFRCYYATSLVAASMLDPEEVAYSIAATPRGGPIEEERAAQAALLREVAGNPFRPVTLGQVIPALWRTPLCRDLAQAAYDKRLPDGTLDPARLAVLSDALEEAGCTEEGLLGHLREEKTVTERLEYPGGSGSSPVAVREHRAVAHVRGCWAVDLVLGRN